jgi:hypothetical protein
MGRFMPPSSLHPAAMHTGSEPQITKAQTWSYQAPVTRAISRDSPDIMEQGQATE